MASRLELQSKLEELHGSENVYFQPPATIKMNYPAIVYKKSKIDKIVANDKLYLKKTCYEVIVIDRKSDNNSIDKLLELPYCTWVRGYVVDGLYHDVFTLYY